MTPFKLENDRQVCVGEFLFVFAFPHINACIPALAWSIVYCDATIYFLTKSYNCFCPRTGFGGGRWRCFRMFRIAQCRRSKVGHLLEFWGFNVEIKIMAQTVAYCKHYSCIFFLSAIHSIPLLRFTLFVIKEFVSDCMDALQPCLKKSLVLCRHFLVWICHVWSWPRDETSH